MPTEMERARSFKTRKGRLGVVRRAAIETLLPRWSVPAGDGPLDLAQVFGAGRPVVLEIGFGLGASTLAMAEAEPGAGVIAAEVHSAGVATLVQGLEARGLDNVRVLLGDGRQLLEERIPSGSLAGIRAYFPDPWPKARHHKRRLVGPGFAALATDRLAPGGTLHCATDWEPYAQQMLAVLSAAPGLALVPAGGFADRPAWRPVTPYESRGLARGHQVFDLIARRPGP